MYFLTNCSSSLGFSILIFRVGCLNIKFGVVCVDVTCSPSTNTFHFLIQPLRANWYYFLNNPRTYTSASSYTMLFAHDFCYIFFFPHFIRSYTLRFSQLQNDAARTLSTNFNRECNISVKVVRTKWKFLNT